VARSNRLATCVQPFIRLPLAPTGQPFSSCRNRPPGYRKYRCPVPLAQRLRRSRHRPTRVAQGHQNPMVGAQWRDSAPFTAPGSGLPARCHQAWGATKRRRWLTPQIRSVIGRSPGSGRRPPRPAGKETGSPQGKLVTRARADGARTARSGAWQAGRGGEARVRQPDVRIRHGPAGASPADRRTTDPRSVRLRTCSPAARHPATEPQPRRAPSAAS